MGMAAVSSTQSKCIDVGDDACRSVSLLCDGGAISCGCRALTRGVGAIGCPSRAVGMGGTHVVNGGDAVGTGGLYCGVHSWRERGTPFWGEFLGCGGWLGTWLAVSSLHLPLFNGLSSRAVAGACFKMARVR